MEIYADFIERERQKIDLLRKKIRECEARIASLLEADPLDDLLEKELIARRPVATEHAAAVTEVPQAKVDPPGSGMRERTKRLTPKWAQLLEYIGREGKSFQQLSKFIADTGIGLTDGAVRTGLMNLRKENGYVENPAKGYYIVTDAALDAISAQKRKDLTE